MIKAAFWVMVLLVSISFTYQFDLNIFKDCPSKSESYDSNNILTSQVLITYDQLKRPVKVTFQGGSLWIVYTQRGDTLYQCNHYSTSSDTDYEKIITFPNGKPTVSLHYDKNNILDQKDSCIYTANFRVQKVVITNYGPSSSGDSLVYVYNTATQITTIKQYGDGRLWGIDDYQYNVQGRISRYDHRDCETCKSRFHELYIYGDNVIKSIFDRNPRGTANGVTISNTGNRINISVAAEKPPIRYCTILSLSGREVFRMTSADSWKTKMSFQLPKGLGNTCNIITVTLNDGSVANYLIRSAF